MRYILQIMAMLSDIIIICMCAIAIWYLPQFGLIGALIVIFLLVQTYNTWKEQGGFIAWKPAMIKRYMKNAKKMGL